MAQSDPGQLTWGNPESGQDFQDKWAEGELYAPPSGVGIEPHPLVGEINSIGRAGETSRPLTTNYCSNSNFLWSSHSFEFGSI
jgi:hypothetical protein